MSLFSLNPKETPKELFGREKELADLIRLLQAGRWVAVLGPRMVGKTSLLKAANYLLEKQKMKIVYVNLWGARGSSDFLKALTGALNEDKSIIQKIKDTRIEGISFGSSGISISVARKPMTTIWDLFHALGRQKETFVIELDEVQELVNISGRFLRILANLFNTYSNIIFVFTGSMFGVMNTLLEPQSTSPLYGRSPAKLYVKPFEAKQAEEFLRKGFKQCNTTISDTVITNAVERLDGIPGWLTLYGNKMCIQRLPDEDALEETKREAHRIVNDELEHFLLNRDRISYSAALKAAAVSSSWTEIKNAVSHAKGSIVNDAIVNRLIQNLKASMLMQEEKGRYRVEDPMLRSLLLTSASTDGM